MVNAFKSKAGIVNEGTFFRNNANIEFFEDFVHNSYTSCWRGEGVLFEHVCDKLGISGVVQV